MFRSKLFLTLSVLATILLLPCSAPAKAAPAERPVTITPLCSTTGSTTAQWRIGNPNPGQATITWIDAATNQTESTTLSYGYTSITTSYDAQSTSPSVTFQQAGLADQTIAINPTACAEATEGCVDGYVRDNLTFDWSSTGTVTVKTAHNALLCADVPVYLSAYTLPTTYSGSGIFDDSSVPQKKYASATAVLHHGTTGNVTLQIAVPNACTNYQLDLYYAPEITEVSYGGHGAQLIYGDIYLHTATKCSKPAGVTLGESTTTPAVLADTGANMLVPTVAATAIAIAAATVQFSLVSRLKKLFAKLAQ